MKKNKPEFILGELTYLEEAGKAKSSGNRLAKYRCFCGNEFITKKTSVNSGKTKSCGCYQAYMTNGPDLKHDSCYTRLYNIWSNMIQRCTNPNNKTYDRYGGRGITVWGPWKKDFRNFQKWASENGYEESLTLDRQDVNGNYEPSNCRWGNRFQQAKNKRKSQFSKGLYKGVCKRKCGKWKASLTSDGVRHSLGSYDSEKVAAFVYDTMAKKYHKDYAHLNSVELSTEIPENFLSEAQNFFKKLSKEMSQRDAMSVLKVLLIYSISDLGYKDIGGLR